MMIKKIHFLILSLVILGCRNYSDSKGNLNKTLLSLKRDTFYIDVPKAAKGNVGPEYNLARHLEEVFELAQIGEGFDSIYIRIWLAYRDDLTDLILIKNDHQKWDAKLTTFCCIKSNINSMCDERQISIVKKPKTGWNDFADKLAGLGFFTLPTDDDIENYSTNSLKRLLVEISTKSFYRLYVYNDPNFNSSKIKEAAQIERILTFLQNELQFKMKEKI